MDNQSGDMQLVMCTSGLRMFGRIFRKFPNYSGISISDFPKFLWEMDHFKLAKEMRCN